MGNATIFNFTIYFNWYYVAFILFAIIAVVIYQVNKDKSETELKAIAVWSVVISVILTIFFFIIATEQSGTERRKEKDKQMVKQIVEYVGEEDVLIIDRVSKNEIKVLIDDKPGTVYLEDGEKVKTIIEQ